MDELEHKVLRTVIGLTLVLIFAISACSLYTTEKAATLYRECLAQQERAPEPNLYCSKRS